ncbi:MULTISPECIES: ABC transporter substrate-binding protein [unclassified Streptomyces]|uniref:ABC transporter substrate-binding protein n=1 Tax=unclassified Streptomyces TaxID=2593676 RepID=UPI0035DA1AF5
MRLKSSRRQFPRAAVALLSLSLISGCGLPGGNGTGAGHGSLTVPTDSPEAAGDWQGTITMFAQEYTPHAEVANGTGLDGLRAAADAWEKRHPGVRIRFVDDKFDDYVTTVRVKAAAGELWDVFWGQSVALNGQWPEGIAYDLTPALKQRNPYAPRYKTWAQAMNPQVINATKSGEGASYNINGDYVISKWYYNKDLFRKAGIKGPPRTWREFTEVCRELREKGVNPVSYVPYQTWMSKHFLTDLYAKDFDRLSRLDGASGFSTSDEALAITDGSLAPENKRFLSWWPAFKKATDHWNRDYVSAPPERNVQAEQDFVAGKAAMYFNGSYFTAKLQGAKPSFAWGSFDYPKVTEESVPDAHGIGTANASGGPTGAYQFAMSTPQANRSMGKKGKAETVLDWLRYLGSGPVSEEIINEAGQFLPSFAGTTPVPAFRKDAHLVREPWRTPFVGFTSPSLDLDLQRVFGNYLGGGISLDTASDEVQRLLDRAAQQYLTAHRPNRPSEKP